MVEENLSLVEEPQIVSGGFDEEFLKLPERVILDVAKGHQRYFGVRDAEGKLLPRYLAVVNTAENPENVRRGNDRVMRARLADAKFFYETDFAMPLAERRTKLEGVVFHKRLGSVADKVQRIERVVPLLGAELGLADDVVQTALAGAALCKCDLVTLMVGELPELQGEMGTAYALAQGVSADVAQVIAEHYQPRGADDPTAPSDAAALVALADRIGHPGRLLRRRPSPHRYRRSARAPTGRAGRARTVLDKNWDLSLSAAIASAYAAFSGVKLDADVSRDQRQAPRLLHPASARLARARAARQRRGRLHCGARRPAARRRAARARVGSDRPRRPRARRRGVQARRQHRQGRTRWGSGGAS